MAGRALLSTLALIAAPIAAGGPQAAPSPDAPAPSLESVRERWEAMGESERAEFRRRLEALREMPEDDRRVLLERARALEARMAELERHLPPEMKDRLAELEPDTRHDILREYLTERERTRGKRVRAHFPPEQVARLEAAAPRERRALLRELHEELRRSAGARVIDFVCRREDVPEEELARLEGLSGRERMRAVLELKRAHLRERIAAEGPPPGVSADEWAALEELPVQEFFEAWGRLRFARGAGFDPDAVRPGEFDRERPPLDPESRWVHRGTLLDELAELARPSLADLLELAHLPARERRDVARGRVRARCVAFLDRHPLLPAPELERLAGLDDAAFVDEVRVAIGRLSTPGAPGGPGRRGPPGRPDRPPGAPRADR